MKKIVLLFLMLCSTAALADVTIRINISGAPSDNRYFLCLTNAGCLSILDAQKGKTFTVDHHWGIRSMYVLDTFADMRLSPQVLPDSCKLTGQDNVTITISGSIKSYNAGLVELEGLSCSRSSGAA